jgi:quercetin dioxygenase-like cupin family protein
MRSGAVHFAPWARTAWHSHPCGQTLYVTEGMGLVQARGRPIIEIHPGDVIYTPTGEEHWLGATPGPYMTHVAMWEVDEQGVSANWSGHVSDEEYQGTMSNRR